MPSPRPAPVLVTSPPLASPTSGRPPSSGTATAANAFTTPSSGRTGAPLNAAGGWPADGLADSVRAKTGLVLDPYFSSTKLAWLLDEVPGLRRRAEAGELCFGTVDSFLLWRLTGGRAHLTDATNASRTQLFDINRQRWDPELLSYFDIPASLLPEVCDSAHAFGIADAEWFGAPIPIAGMAGDQQAALIGQGCLAEGTCKSTYGTGCFLMTNTGAEPRPSGNGLLTTVAYRLRGQATYALEGSIFVAGVAVKWLRDQLGLIDDAAETESLARSVDGDAQGVVFVPAFTGLGAPHWSPNARGTLSGLTLDTLPAHIVTAALQSVGFQTAELLDAMSADGAAVTQLNVRWRHGGQRLALPVPGRRARPPRASTQDH